MKFKPLLKEVFLLREGRSESITLDKAASIYNEASPNHSTSDIKNVYRGKAGGSDFLYIDPSQYKRTSANADNQYTLWIDNRWPAKFPRRSRSIICSTSIVSAEVFGDPYIVLPLEDADFGVVPHGDIWGGFKPYIKKRYETDLPGFFVGVLSHFLKMATGGEREHISDESYSEMMEDLSILQSLTKEEWEKYGKMGDDPESMLPDNSVGCKRFSEDVIQHNGELINFLHNKVLNWEVNGFEVKRFSELGNVGSKEVWTSSECLMIKKGVNFSYFKQKVID